MKPALRWYSCACGVAVWMSLLSGALAADSRLPWKEVSGSKIPVPPGEHPRLYLRAEHVSGLPARLADPVLQPAVESLRSRAAKSIQARMEWDALRYLTTRDRALGRATIEATLALLKKTELPVKQDACRVTGRMMVTGAIVYDWIYPLLTAEEKRAWVAEQIRLAKTQECGYPPKGQGSVTGHASEAMIMRDMISAGIALYDEYPEMYELAAGRFFREHLPVRNWLYPGQAYHQGDSYGMHRFSWDTYPLWIFERLGAGPVYDPNQRFVPYYYLYVTRPDGQRMRGGDTFAHNTPRGKPWSEYLGTLLTASYYHDGVLLDEFQRQGGSGGNESLFEFLWRDTALKPVPINTLPLSRYFGSPFGWMVARTGWDESSVIAEMKINEYNFVNHQHLDAGAFQIYYRGALTMDSGLYYGSSGHYGSPHCRNYYWRTIAHNSLLIYDPQEKFSDRGDYGNEGGQRLPNRRSEAKNLEALLAPNHEYRTGQVLAQGFGPQAQSPAYSLLQGDITAAYSKKVRQVTRTFVFLNLHDQAVPAAMVVLDRVVSADPSFRKYWLLHSQEEPTLSPGTATLEATPSGNSGRLTLDVVWPPLENLELRKVGGPEREFWVFGTNYANAPEPGILARSSMELGAWRVEVSPRQPAAEDVLLNVMQVTDRKSNQRWPVRRIEVGERLGCVLTGPAATWVTLFRRDNLRSPQPLEFTVPGTGKAHVLVSDLAPGLWRARREGGSETFAISVTESSGAAWLDGPAGKWRLERSL